VRLNRRVARLIERLPRLRPKGAPTDPAALLIGLRDGTVRMADFDRTDADQASALTFAAALLVAWTGVSGAR